MFEDGGRVEKNFMTYYFNDSIQIGAVLFGNMPLAVGKSQVGTSLTVFHPQDKEVLKKFRVDKSDKILFSSRLEENVFFNVIGLIRDSNAIKVSEYINVKEGRKHYMVKTIKFKNRDAYEGLIRIDQTSFLSIIYYHQNDHEEGHVEDFNTIMTLSARRIFDGKSMTPVLDVFQDAEDLFADHGYLTPFILAKNRNIYRENNLLNQALATYYSFSGNFDLAQHDSEAFMETNKKNIDANNLLPAKKIILNQTANKQIVMFNTSHYLPQHAYFVGELIDSLYRQGFTHFALEGLGDAATVMKNGFVSFNDGIYIRDPVYSNLINKARELGYNIIGYDTDANDREKQQAQNIFDQSLKMNRDCKIVVLAGYDHINEISTPKRMAGFFKEISGIDPFTIDQTTLATSSCKNLPPNNKEEVFVYSNKNLKANTDLMIWNNIDMENKSIDYHANQGSDEVKV